MPDLSQDRLVVATVTSQSDLDLLQSRGCPEKIDVLEFRLDALASEVDQVAELLPSMPQTIITARVQAEGGCYEYPDDEARISQIRPFLGKATFVDLEVRSMVESAPLEVFAEVIAETTTNLVASYHDFRRTPEIRELEEALEQARGLGADIFKAAVHLKEMEDLFALVEFLEQAPIPVSLMGMGPLGKLSRLVLARAGSVLNYGYLQEANAPGQWPAAELKRLIGEISE